MIVALTRTIRNAILAGLVCLAAPLFAQDASPDSTDEAAAAVKRDFDETTKPLLAKYCIRCHNADNKESGIRVDQLDGSLAGRRPFLWEAIQKQVDTESMPPEDERQPTAREREQLSMWIKQAIVAVRSRPQPKNGSTRRLTIAQYRNTLRELLGIDDDLTDLLPPDTVSKDGFLNNSESMLLSPLLIEAYFEVAEKLLDRCDRRSRHEADDSETSASNWAGAINEKPFPDKLILGANSHLLANEDFVVSEPTPDKPFAFEPFRMKTNYRFIEGYQGNATVRGWREYDSIYHSVFACMRGNGGYPKGKPYETVPEGLLLRPAIPSAELFQIESTYGPKANFKISLRELPDRGKFRVTVKAAKYNDGLLLDGAAGEVAERSDDSIIVNDLSQPRTVNVPDAGVYQVNVYLSDGVERSVMADASRLDEGLIGVWPLDGQVVSDRTKPKLKGELLGGAKFRGLAFRSSSLRARPRCFGDDSARRRDGRRRWRVHRGGLDSPSAVAAKRHRLPRQIQLDARMVSRHAKRSRRSTHRDGWA